MSVIPALLLSLGVVGLTALGLMAFLVWLDHIGGGGPRVVNVYVDQRNTHAKTVGDELEVQFRALDRPS